MALKSSSRRFFINRKYRVSVIFFLLIVASLIFFNRIFQIEEIKIIDEENNTKLAGLDFLHRQNILLLDKKKASVVINKRNPFLKTVNIVKQYPNKIVIFVKKDQPIAILKSDQGVLLLSDTGKIIFKKKDYNDDLPLINFYQNIYYYQYQSGELIDLKEIQSVLNFLKIFRDLNLKVDTVDIAGVNMVAFNLKDKQIYFSLEKNSQTQQYQLEAVIRQFKIEGKNFTKIDLRFNKPVIKFD